MLARVVLLISFPVEMNPMGQAQRFPMGAKWYKMADGISVATTLGAVKEGEMQVFDLMHHLLGINSGSMGDLRPCC